MCPVTERGKNDYPYRMFSVMSGQAGQADASVAVVESLLGVVAGRLPFDVAEALLVDALIVYLDGKQVSTSKSSWFGWVRFLQRNAARKRISDLDISIDRICTRAADGVDVVDVEAIWHGVVGGRALSSKVGTISYHVADGKVSKIYTHKKNYIFIYGPSITNSFVFYTWVVRMMLWRFLAGV